MSIMLVQTSEQVFLETAEIDAYQRHYLNRLLQYELNRENHSI